MNVEVELPDLGAVGGDHATVVEWRFEEGEYVEEGEVLLEVASDSGSVEVPAPRSGTLVERIVDEDELVRVGEPVALIDCDEEETDEDIDPDEEEDEPVATDE